MGDSSVKVDIDINYNEQQIPVTLTLTPNIDIPTRNSFKHLENKCPKVQLIYWIIKDTNILKYATVIECNNGDVGIWCGLFCNQHFILNNGDKK